MLHYASSVLKLASNAYTGEMRHVSVTSGCCSI